MEEVFGNWLSPNVLGLGAGLMAIASAAVNLRPPILQCVRTGPRSNLFLATVRAADDLRMQLSFRVNQDLACLRRRFSGFRTPVLPHRE